MPFYEYECAACGRYHEAMQKMSDAPLKACPACGKPRLVRLISAPQFRLKGAGWYETDFKGAADAKRNLADSAEPAAKADDAKEDKVRVKPSKLAAGARKAAASVKRTRKKVVKQAAKKKVVKQAANKAAKKVAKKVAKKAPKKAAPKPVAGRKAPRKKKSTARKAARPK
jgi:putative FmdB family regulatory protein